jgi:hypothetical protein
MSFVFCWDQISVLRVYVAVLIREKRGQYCSDQARYHRQQQIPSNFSSRLVAGQTNHPMPDVIVIEWNATITAIRK